jgi:phosphoribosylpyrophosphate synthetase
MPRSTDIFYRAVGACFASSLLHSVHAASQPVPSGGQAQLDRNPRHFAMDIMLNQCRGYDAAGLERSLSCAKMVDRLDNALIISGTSNPQLAEEVAWETGKTLAKVSVSRFPDGECTVKLEDNVRGKDVYILQSASAPINDSFVESLLIATAARRADARTVTLLAPSMAYGRSTGSKTASDHSEEGVGVLMNAHQQEEEEGSSTVTSAASGLPRALKALLAAHPWVESSSSSSGSSSGSQEEADATNSRLRAEGLAVSTAAAASTLLAAASRSASASRPSTFASPLPAVEANSISAADCALMLVASGVDRVISVELSPAGGGQVEGFFPPQVPVENLRASTILVDFCSKLKLQRPTVVAPNEECIQLAMDIRAGLSQKLPGVDVGLAVIVGALPGAAGRPARCAL